MIYSTNVGASVYYVANIPSSLPDRFIKSGKGVPQSGNHTLYDNVVTEQGKYA